MAFLPITSESIEPGSPPKRISTPAGMRLSTILENSNGNNANSSRVPKRSSMISFGKTSASSVKGQSESGISSQGYSYSIFAEKAEPPLRRLPRVRGCECFSRKGGWKRVTVFLGLLLITIVALIAGVVVGMRRHASKKYTSSFSVKENMLPSC
jgi:hypothetical protein